MQLYSARQRRRLNRGLRRKQHSLLKRLRKAKKEAPPMEKPEVVKTHLRDMIILPEMVGSMVGVYNGKTFNQVEIKVSWGLAGGSRTFTESKSCSFPVSGRVQAPPWSRVGSKGHLEVSWRVQVLPWSWVGSQGCLEMSWRLQALPWGGIGSEGCLEVSWRVQAPPWSRIGSKGHLEVSSCGFGLLLGGWMAQRDTWRCHLGGSRMLLWRVDGSEGHLEMASWGLQDAPWSRPGLERHL